MISSFYLRVFGLRNAESFEYLDSQLCGYIEHLRLSGEGRNLAGDGFSGAQLFLRTKKRFPAAWDLFKVWYRMEMPKRVPPLTAFCATPPARATAASEASLEPACAPAVCSAHDCPSDTAAVAALPTTRCDSDLVSYWPRPPRPPQMCPRAVWPARSHTCGQLGRTRVASPFHP